MADYVMPSWLDLPNTSTPIMAQRLIDIGQGIIDAQDAAAAAQATADAALGGASGSVAIPGLHLNGTDATPTDDGPIIANFLDDVGDGLYPNDVVVMGTSGKVCYVNSTVQIQDSRIRLRFTVPVLMGPNGRFRIFGAVSEVPVNVKPKLTADAALGATVLHLSDVSYFSAGNTATIRGHRDATGNPTQIFSFKVVSKDITDPLDPTITITPGLDEAYLATNVTPWSNKFSQVTRVEAGDITSTANRGDRVITLSTTTPFDEGQVVQIIDDEHTIDGDLEIEDGNFVHKEQALVTEVIDGTHIRIDHALFHSYTGDNARVQVLSAPRASTIEDLECRWTETNTATTNAFECRYAFMSGFRNLKVIGVPGASWTTQAYRLTDSLACFVERWAAQGADDVTAGRGYGATFYGSTLCWISGGYASSCRHSVLWFNGAAGNMAFANHSVDARISDYDAHGADCVDNLIFGNTATGGDQHTPDSSERTAFKIGNPSHVTGDGHNVVRGNLVTNYRGTAFEILPDGKENQFIGNTVRDADVGIRALQLDAPANALTMGAIFADNDFTDVTLPIDFQGGTPGIIVKTVIDNNRWRRCGNFEAHGAPGLRFTRNQIMDPVTGTGYILTLEDCAGAEVKGNDFGHAYRGLGLSGCTNVRVFGNVFHDLTGGTVVLKDDGTNGGILWAGNPAYGFTPTSTGSASSGTITL